MKMICIVCDMKLQSATCLKIWVENPSGALVRLGRETPATAYLCANQAGQRNVCREALKDGRTYLNDDECRRCHETGKILERVV